MAEIAQSEVDRHLAAGEAALMLVECLMHALAKSGAIDLDDLVEEVETALEAKRRLAEEGAHPRLAGIAAGILTELVNSLSAGDERGR